MALRAASASDAGGSSRDRRCRSREAEVGAQRLALVGGAEQAALLQERHNLGNEHVEDLRQHRRHQVESVRNAIVDPILHQIGNLLRRTFEGEMATGAGELREQLPQRWTLLSDKSHDHLGSASGGLVGARVGEVLRRKRLVERQM